MNSSKKLSPFTLLPSDKAIRSKLVELFDRNIIYSVILGTIVSFASFLLNLIGFSLPSTKASISDYESIIIMVADISRICAYIIVALFAYYFPRVRKYFVLTTPIIFTITITEVHIALDRFENIYLR